MVISDWKERRGTWFVIGNFLFFLFVSVSDFLGALGAPVKRTRQAGIKKKVL